MPPTMLKPGRCLRGASDRRAGDDELGIGLRGERRLARPALMSTPTGTCAQQSTGRPRMSGSLPASSREVADLEAEADLDRSGQLGDRLQAHREADFAEQVHRHLDLGGDEALRSLWPDSSALQEFSHSGIDIGEDGDAEIEIDAAIDLGAGGDVDLGVAAGLRPIGCHGAARGEDVLVQSYLSASLLPAHLGVQRVRTMSGS